MDNSFVLLSIEPINISPFDAGTIDDQFAIEITNESGDILSVDIMVSGLLRLIFNCLSQTYSNEMMGDSGCIDFENIRILLFCCLFIVDANMMIPHEFVMDFRYCCNSNSFLHDKSRARVCMIHCLF